MLESITAERPMSILARRAGQLNDCEWCGSLIQVDHFLHHCYICPKVPSILKLDALLHCQLGQHSNIIDKFMYKQLHLNYHEFEPFMRTIEAFYSDHKLYFGCNYCSNNFGPAVLMEHVFTCLQVPIGLKYQLLDTILNKMDLSHKRIKLNNLVNSKLNQLPLEKFRQEKSESEKMEVARQLKMIREQKEKVSLSIKRSDSAVNAYESIKKVKFDVPLKAKLDPKLLLYTSIKVKELEIERIHFVQSILEAVSKADPSDHKYLLEIASQLNDPEYLSTFNKD